MTDEAVAKSGRSWSTIVGFACNQGFLYALFYLEPNQSLVLGGMAIERAELLGTLFFMFLSLYAVATLSPKQRSVALSPRFVLAYAIILVLGAGVPAFVGTQDLISIAYESICVGIPSALMLCAWGRVLGGLPARSCAPDVFIGLGLGALICFVFSLLPIEGAYAILYFAPFGSALFLRRLAQENKLSHIAVSVRPENADLHDLSFKILFGTCLFGLAVGMLEANAQRFGSPMDSIPLTFLLFVLYCVAALQLFGGRPASWSAASVAANDEESPLDASYRLAVLLLVSGILLTPALDRYIGIDGEAIVLVGYLAITAVLVTLFLLLAHIVAGDASLAFARGFMALFAGEFLGLLIANFVNACFAQGEASSLLVGLAGIIVLVAYLFLFTDRDMKQLSVVVEKVDSFELAVTRIIEEGALSKREAEILPFVLRGRSSERIANELFISKNTVDTHIRKIYAKCQVHSRQELIDYSERVQNELRP